MTHKPFCNINQIPYAASFSLPFVGDDTLVGSIWRTLTTPGIQAVVSVGEPQRVDGRDRRAWSTALRSRIEDLRRPG